MSNKVKFFYFNDNDFLKLKIYKIPVGIDLDEFYFDKYSKSKKFDLVSVSGYSDPKGIKNLLNLAIELKKRKKNYKLHILANPIKTQSENINFVQKQILKYNLDNIQLYDKFDDMNKFYEKSNLFLCLSNSEGGPLTVWEAMSKGKIVVSFNVGGISEIIKNNYDGYYINNKKIINIIKKIELLTVDEKLARKINYRARIKIKTKLDFKSTNEKLLKII